MKKSIKILVIVILITVVGVVAYATCPRLKCTETTIACCTKAEACPKLNNDVTDCPVAKDCPIAKGCPKAMNCTVAKGCPKK